jgi:hypothetical protein
MRNTSARLIGILIVLVFAGVVYAAPVFSSCEGGEEGVAAVDLTPNSSKFKFTEWQQFTVKNTGTKAFESVSLSITITKGTGSAFSFEENKCAEISSSKKLNPGSTCTVKIVCNEWEADATVQVVTNPFASDKSSINSTP